MTYIEMNGSLATDEKERQSSTSKEGIQYHETLAPGNYRIGHLMQEEEQSISHLEDEISDISSFREDDILTIRKFSFEEGTSNKDLSFSEISALDDLESASLMVERDRRGEDMKDATDAGEVLVALDYNHNTGVFGVEVVKARNLVPYGKRKVDPYVKVYLSSPSFPRIKKRTRAAKGTLAPVFNEVRESSASETPHFLLAYMNLSGRKFGMIYIWMKKDSVEKYFKGVYFRGIKFRVDLISRQKIKK